MVYILRSLLRRFATKKLIYLDNFAIEGMDLIGFDIENGIHYKKFAKQNGINLENFAI